MSCNMTWHATTEQNPEPVGRLSLGQNMIFEYGVAVCFARGRHTLIRLIAVYCIPRLYQVEGGENKGIRFANSALAGFPWPS